MKPFDVLLIFNIKQERSCKLICLYQNVKQFLCTKGLKTVQTNNKLYLQLPDK